MPLAELVDRVRSLFTHRERRAWMTDARAHIELRRLSDDELAEFRDRIDDAYHALERVRWVEVNAYTNRVVVCFEPGAYALDELIAVVDEVEEKIRVTGAPFGEDRHEHPADAEPAARTLLELCGDAAGLSLGVALRFSPIPASSLAGNAAAILTILKGSERLRGGLDERYGIHPTDLVLNLSIAMSQGMAQRPVSSLVDIASRVSQLREIHARRSVWQRREAELCSQPSSDPAAVRREERPVPIRRGPIEEYADRAWFVALGGFAISFLTTRSVQRATAALFGGIPKPARLGREVFAAELAQVLASRGMMMLDAEALRLLDRVDCVVLQGNMISKEKFVIADVIPGAGTNAGDLDKAIRKLFDPEAPLTIRRSARWVLAPLPLLDADVDEVLRERARGISSRGAIVLGVLHDGGVVGLVKVEVTPQTGVEELIKAAHDAQMRVVIATDDESTLEGLNADDVIPGGDDMKKGIRRLQREGSVVCVVATGRSPGLSSADFGIGLCGPGEPPPWGAHIICREDLVDVRFLIQACVTARAVAKQSVNIALGAATVGAFVSAGGLLPMTYRRVLFVVNTATLLSMANGVRNSYAVSRRALPPPRDPTPWHALDPDGALSRLGVTREGLRRHDVVRRTRAHVAKRAAVLEFADAVTDELFNPLSPLLAAGAGLSAVVGSVADAGMVAGVVGLNALVGGTQRYRTELAVEQLAHTSRRHSTVVRDGQRCTMPADDLVRGDIIELSAGEIVPADSRIISSTSLEVDGASLTGESLPVRKSEAPSFEVQVADRSSMLYEGTAIAAGKVTAVVVALGDETEARRSSKTVNVSRGQVGVEARLRQLMALTGPVALGAGIGVVGAGLLRGRRLADVVGSGVSLAVAAVPEGLPLIATAAQLSAAKRLAGRGALVRNARSIEALGRVNVVCFDKTGTVTKGHIELSEVGDGEVTDLIGDLGRGRAHVLAVGLRASAAARHETPMSDPTDEALSAGAKLAGIRADYGADEWKRTAELYFEAGRGYHAVLGETREEGLLCVKGAPEVILPSCATWHREGGTTELEPDDRQHLAAQATELARSGLRVLSVAEKRMPARGRLEPRDVRDLVFRGFVAFRDPVRPSAAAAIDGLRRVGVDAIMITGDHPSTAENIAMTLGLVRGRRVVTGAELSELKDEELDAVLSDVAVFARVTPSHKVRIVRALQRTGKVVAMAGDGANDAPAIRLADVGIAVGEKSTSAARSAADVVLTDERIETLVEAIVEGRAMWSSVRDALSILIGGNLGEIGFTLAAGLVDGRPPLNARQLLLVNLLTDVAPAMAIALRPPTKKTLDELANEGPDASLAGPLNRDIAWRAVVTAAGAGSAWLVGRFTGTRGRATTIGLAALVGTQLGQTLASGGLSRPVVLTSLGSMGALFTIIQTPGVSHFFGCQPLGPIGWATATGAAGLATFASVKLPVLGAQLVEAAERRFLGADAPPLGENELDKQLSH